MNRNPAMSDLDQMLHGYFRTQLPQAWPAAPVDTRPVRTSLPVRRSYARLTLAASIALLLGLGGVLSYAPQSPNSPGGAGLLKDASADGKKLEKHIFPEHQPKLPGSHP